MLAIEIQDHARKMLAAYGDRALVEVAQKASALERTGEKEQANDWRRIEKALREMRGPRST